jgi:hypothetical protein
MSASERFVTTDKRYWPAVGAIRPPPTVFIVLEPIELALEPDLSVFLSDFRCLRSRPTMSSSRPGGLLHRFPPKWRGIESGMTRNSVVRTLGKPRGIATRHDLSRPFESWFYGLYGQYAIVFINGKVFVKAAANCCCCPEKYTHLSPRTSARAALSSTGSLHRRASLPRRSRPTTGSRVLRKVLPTAADDVRATRFREGPAPSATRTA